MDIQQRPKGFISVKSIVDLQGNPVSNQDAVSRGWFVPFDGERDGFELDGDEIPIGPNLWTDSGRQALAYAFGFRSPISNYTCQLFGVGTGSSTVNVTNTNLDAPILLSNSAYTKQINGVDYPSPFVARVDFTLGVDDANGFLITEFGLYAGNGTLLARKTSVGINKTNQFSPTFLWRVRF